MTVQDLADMLALQPTEVVKLLFMRGIMVGGVGRVGEKGGRGAWISRQSRILLGELAGPGCCSRAASGQVGWGLQRVGGWVVGGWVARLVYLARLGTAGGRGRMVAHLARAARLEPQGHHRT